ncbi:MAG: TIGR03984 family CRISPR-associated protein [Cyanobacteria bacterium]|jgi:CRISPR-associated protein (TIGR03984 family)|nr:TIGR03984 family CRISPR-associated protein [Cyanobacteria bacterium GSL.Bin21]
MSQTESKTLYSYHSDQNLTLEEAITNCNQVLESAIALLYSPQSCQLAQLKQDTLKNSQDQPIGNLNEVFEARIFNTNYEVRWLNCNNGKGKAVLLTENHLEQLESFGHLDSINYERIEQQYLLWGQKAKSLPNNNNWQRLSEARIGNLDIPLKQAVQKNQRVYLKTYEYLSNEFDQYGNFSVIEERLVKLEVN